MKAIMAGKFTDTLKADYLELLRTGVRRMAAAEAIGVNYSTIWRHVESDEGFARAVELAERRANEEVEDALFQAAISGNLTAIQVWLYNRWPDRWKDQRGRALAEKIPDPDRAHEMPTADPDADDPEQPAAADTDAGEIVAGAPDPARVVELSKWLRESKEAG